MTPTWAVILVALISAVFGSLLTTLATISHERAAERRAHQLNAADEFSTAVIVGLRQARNAAGEVRKDTTPLGDEAGGFRPDIQAHFDEANGAVDDVFAKEARVRLLFGDPSPTSAAAGAAANHLQLMVAALERRPRSVRDHEEMSNYSLNFSGSQEQHEKFNRAALAVLEQSWWDRFRERRRLRKEVVN